MEPKGNHCLPDCSNKVGDLPDMSQDIVQEVIFFLHSILMGLVITFAYDWILILRELFAHGRLHGLSASVDMDGVCIF